MIGHDSVYGMRPQRHGDIVSRTPRVPEDLLSLYLHWAGRRLMEDDDDEQYEHAVRLLKDKGFTSADAHGLIVHPEFDAQDRDLHHGIFISAIYNLSPEQVIYYDVPADDPKKSLNHFGYRSDKVLVIETVAGFQLGKDQSSFIINRGTTGTLHGGRDGIFINIGKYLSHRAPAGITINAGKTELIIPGNSTIDGSVRSDYAGVSAGGSPNHRYRSLSSSQRRRFPDECRMIRTLVHEAQYNPGLLARYTEDERKSMREKIATAISYDDYGAPALSPTELAEREEERRSWSPY
jgi:hypothetical protein